MDIRSTFLTKLWIDGDREFGRQVYGLAEESPDAETLAARIKGLVSDGNPLRGNSVYSDLLGLALESVDYQSIAEVILSKARQAA